MKYPDIPLTRLVAFVEEDAPFGDITTESILPAMSCNAYIIAKEDLILAGLSEITALFTHYGVKTDSTLSDGISIQKGTRILTLSGSVHAILLVERTALNLLGRMSGIATKTREIQGKIAAVNSCCRVTATRKTAPGLRLIDKKAAIIGGADPHRSSLSDAILIKDTHRTILTLDEAIRRAKSASLYHLIEAEAESADEAVQAARAGADIILLDNMKADQIRETLDQLNNEGLRECVKIELSGGHNPGYDIRVCRSWS